MGGKSIISSTAVAGTGSRIVANLKGLSSTEQPLKFTELIRPGFRNSLRDAAKVQHFV